MRDPNKIARVLRSPTAPPLPTKFKVIQYFRPFSKIHIVGNTVIFFFLVFRFQHYYPRWEFIFPMLEPRKGILRK